jgi:hypothetical protein
MSKPIVTQADLDNKIMVIIILSWFKVNLQESYRNFFLRILL